MVTGEEFRDPELAGSVLARIGEELQEPLRFMEVCGTHTVAIFQSGLRSLLPEALRHISGPGCPVCVTHPEEIAAALLLARRPGVMTVTFGDMMRVPGPDGSSLKTVQAEGARTSICYSPFEALRIASENPQLEVVFLAVGFETTAPAVAATVQRAREDGIGNFSVLSCHKRIPPALRHLLQSGEVGVDGFLLPGHVSTIIGLGPYRFLAEELGQPAVVTGFEPLDILQGLLMLARMRKAGAPRVANQYARAVNEEGNRTARRVMDAVFRTVTAKWRGLGPIGQSGLDLAPEFADFDARRRFDLEVEPAQEPRGCSCGEVLQGKLRPDGCPLFGRACTPANPVGPCMVSTEGSCAAYFKYAT
jgi:hydrogenase expression/formation protein HypD